MEMKQITYADMVAHLAKPGADILNTLTPEKCHLIHMAVGISGEVAELYQAMNELRKVAGEAPTQLKENILEELGDVEFYFEGLCAAVGATRVPASDVADFLHGLVISGEILDLVKKHVIYNQHLRLSDLGYAIAQFESFMLSAYVATQITRQEALDANYAKLMTKRYPNGYTDAAAEARADKQA